MYKTRIKSWGLDKNFKESEVVELFRLKRERDRLGKIATTYCIRGREVDWERVQSYVKRKGLNMAVLINTAPQSPSSGEVSCRTPTPEDAEQRTVLAMSPASSSASPSVGTRTPVTAMHYRPPSPHEVRGPLPPPNYRPPSTSSSSASFSTQRPETMHRLQSFLGRTYETVLYEDGDKSWGTTEYWLRNARSQEWIMTARYKLALYRDYIQSESTRGTPEVLRFRAINRSFAMLEPLSGGVIGSRMFYLVSFFHAFAESNPFQNPFAETARYLLEALETSSAAPSLSSLASSENAKYSRLPDLTSMDEDYDMEGAEPDHNPPRTPRFADGQVSFQEATGRFLLAVLSRMVKMLGVKLPSETLLLLQGDKDGYPSLPPSDAWQYPPPIIQWPSRPSPSPPHRTSARHQPQQQRHAYHHSQHLSPRPDTTTAGTIQASASVLDHSIWLLAQRNDAQAEEMLFTILSAVDKDQHPPASTPGAPIPSSPSSTFFPSASPSEVGAGGSGSPHHSSREAQVLGRCTHYHLSRIFRRRAAATGGEARSKWQGRAREHMVRAVRGSLLFDSFLGWDEVEFLFA
ncbi:hypothetical protein V8F20_001731 [Naviculisporaceae sp. PSN 640]